MVMVVVVVGCSYQCYRLLLLLLSVRLAIVIRLFTALRLGRPFFASTHQQGQAVTISRRFLRIGKKNAKAGKTR